jgi:signal transduction histidine kinase/ligand-binding sensor domain-containing protein
MNPGVAHTIPTSRGELFAINTVYRDPRGPLLVTALNGRVYQVRDRILVPLDLPSDVASVSVRNTYRARDGTLWLGTDGHGVIRINGPSSQRFTTRNGLVNDFVRAFCEDREGVLWIGTDGGVSRWRSGRFESYRTENGLAYGSVRVLMEDRRGTIWIATDVGVSRFSHGEFLPVGPFAGIRAHKVWALFEDRDGGIWLGTHGAGLYLFKSGQLVPFTSVPGLPGKIHYIAEDGMGNLWITSASGICSVARKDLERSAGTTPGMIAVRIYNTSDGLPTNHISGGVQSAGAVGRDGSLWFPTAQGLVSMTSGTPRETDVPQVLIERVVADGRELMSGSAALRIPPGPGKLEVQYTAIHLRSPERLRFRYWMEGAEPGWNDVSDRRVAYFNRLPPAQYRFHVAAYEVNHPERLTERVTSIVLEPPFYRTWWFLAVGGLCAIAIVWTAYRLHVRNVRRRFAAVLEERSRVAREMHDTVIQGCVGVSALLEAVSSTGQSAPERSAILIERARTEIRSTVEDARAALLNLRQTLDGGIPEAVEKLTTRVANESGVPVEFHTNGAARSLDAEAELGLLLAVREALRNSVRHASPKRIAVSLNYTRAWLEVSVEDDGSGFRAAANVGGTGENHYGLIGIKERVERVGGRFALESALGKGTRVTLAIPARSIGRSSHSKGS